MSNRLKQFFQAITPRITENDLMFIKTYLNKTEINLFEQMDTATKQHSLQVAKLCLKNASKQDDIPVELLVKAALLHDIAKIAGSLPVLYKILTVLGDSICPRWWKTIGQTKSGGLFSKLREAVYLYYNHALIGAQIIRQAGSQEPVVSLVKYHHAKLRCGLTLSDEPGFTGALKVLQEADQNN